MKKNSKIKDIKVFTGSHVILEKNGKIFLMRRYQTGFKDGFYGLPAGHKEFKETLLACAVREAYEECGVRIREEDLEFVFVVHKYGKDEKENRIEVIFRCKKWKGEPMIMEEHKCDMVGWFSKNKLPDNTVEYIAECIKNLNRKKIFLEIYIDDI